VSLPGALYEVAALGQRSALLLADLGRIEEVGRSLEVSLDTLRTMLVFYGLCALAAGSAAVVLSRADAFASFSAQLGFNAELVTNGLYLCAALLMGVMWRQGRRVRPVVPRRAGSRQEGFDRSMGAGDAVEGGPGGGGGQAGPESSCLPNCIDAVCACGWRGQTCGSARRRAQWRTTPLST